MSEPAAAAPTCPPRWFLPALLVLHGALALVYTQIIPVDRGPDEPHHLLYIEHFEKYGDLPYLTSEKTTRDDRDGSIAIHPPLYYVACWPLYHLVRHWSEPRIQMVFRFVALLLAWGTLLLAARLLSGVFPDQPSIVMLALVVIALLPEFQLLSAVQNNDGAMMLLSTGLALLLFERLDRAGEVRDWAWIGVALGAVVLTKATGAAFLPVPLLLLWKQARDHGWSPGAVARRAAAFLAGPLVLDFWWFARNKHYSGHYHPIYRWTGHPFIFDSLTDFLVGGQRSWICLKRFVLGAQQSLWGQVDWYLPQRPGEARLVAYPAGVALYDLFTALEIAAGLGLLWVWLRSRRRPLYDRRQHFALLLAAALFGLLYAALAHYTLFVHPGGFQGGRYLMPAVAPFALLFSNGLLSPLPPKLRPWLVGLIAVLLVLWNLACMANITGYLNPLYAPGEGIQINFG